MVVAVVCATFVLGLNGASGAKEYRTGPGLLTGCEMYQAFSSVNEAWREGRITERELVLKKARAYYGVHPALDSNCDEEVLDQLERELLEDVYRLAEELRPSDRTYLQSLSIEVAEALDRETDGIEELEARAPAAAGSVFDRISVAVDAGQLSLKEAVILKAKHMYAPHLVPANSEFAPVSGKPAGEECDTGFYKDLHRVKDLLTGQEKALLRSLSPDFDAIVRSWRQVAPSALPNFPQLDKTFEGKKCIVHYTLAGDDAVPNAKYPKWVASYIDEAVAAETAAGHFRAAYAEGGGKLHVYCVKMGANGEWVDVSDVAGTGKRKSGYIKISSAIKNNFGASWKAKLAGVAYHEYFHGVQSAYNWESDLWFMEATSVWASCYYGGDYKHVKSYYTAADSIFKKPNDNLWLTTYRKYSTSALAFFLGGKFGGHKIIKAYFEKSETEDDAVTNLKATLAAQEGSPVFGDLYKEFLLRMYAKKIASVKSYLPDVKLEATHNNYGVPLTDGNVMLLGANFYKLEKPGNATLRAAPLIAILEKGATGNPQGVLAQKGKTAPSAVQDGRSYLPKAVDAVFIAVDVDYAGKDVAGRPYKYTAVTPHVTINEVTADSPIQSGSYSNIHIMYDLLGTVAGETFWTTVKVVEKGPDVADNVSGDFDLPVGNNQDLHLYFNTSNETEGTYKFSFQLKVPIDSWKIPQVKSKGSCIVVVEKPPESASMRPGTGTPRGGALEIRR
jgi:hypothetical protein